MAYAKVQTIDRVTLGTLTPDQAKAEGYPTVQEFEIAFVERHDRGWLNTQVSYLLEQGVPQIEADETRDCWAKVRYDNIWASREVWLLTILPFDDLPLLLPGLVEEPEAIPVDRLKRKWSEKAAKRYQDARGEEERVRDAKQLGRRLRSAKLRDAGAPELAVIEEQLRLLEARYSKAA